MKEDKQLKEISQKLDSFIRLLAVSITLDRNQKEQIKLLSNAGFKPNEMAKVIGTTANTVRVTLAQIRKRSKRR